MKQLLQLDLINNPVSKLPGYREKMFKIFPTINILDTLDKSGKDAYASSSMALSVARVPDALFDKSAPAPVTYTAPIVPPAPSRTKSISKPTSTTTLPKTTVAPASTAVVRTGSKLSTKSKIASKDITSSKKGKSGKIGKLPLAGKSRSASTRAGISFPVGRIKRRLR